MTTQENRQVIEDSIKNISFYNAYKIQETGSRENEIEEQKDVLKTLGQEDKIKDVDDELSKQFWETPYKEMTKLEQLDRYKELYNKQEHYYIYDSQNEKTDVNHAMNELKNLKELYYIENHVLSDYEKYHAQYEVSRDVLNEQSLKNIYDERLENENIQQHNMNDINNNQEQNATINSDTNNKNNVANINHVINNVADDDKHSDNTRENSSQDIDSNSDKKVYEFNKQFLNDNKNDLTKINEDRKKFLDQKKKEAKEIEKLNGKDIMKKIVEEQGKNSAYLTKDDENVLDARANVNNTYNQIANNNTAQYGSTQTARNTSYTNAYTSLQNSSRINTANYNQNRDNENQQREEEKENQNNTRDQSQTQRKNQFRR